VLPYASDLIDSDAPVLTYYADWDISTTVEQVRHVLSEALCAILRDPVPRIENINEKTPLPFGRGVPALGG
jgi:hypothetical protein